MESSVANTDGNLIGGTTPEARNIISANGGRGVLVRNASDTVQGNFIGTDVTGSNPHGQRAPKASSSSGNNVPIGGTAAGAATIIAHNGDNGVVITRRRGE